MASLGLISTEMNSKWDDVFPDWSSVAADGSTNEMEESCGKSEHSARESPKIIASPLLRALEPEVSAAGSEVWQDSSFVVIETDDFSASSSSCHSGSIQSVEAEPSVAAVTFQAQTAHGDEIADPTGSSQSLPFKVTQILDSLPDLSAFINGQQ
jgi:hypothetical protein